MKASSEFVVGKHGIGWVGSDFKKHFNEVSFEARPTPTFKKLELSMKDSEIEKDLNPGICDLGDILAFIDNAPQECKDGYANLFYTPACVVYVYWDADGGGCYVSSWRRGDFEWGAGARVFSPATIRSVPLSHCCHSCALELELSEIKKRLSKIETFFNPDLLK